MNILVVDDQADARLYLRELLEQEGHAVAEAVDGDEALTQARAEPPDLVIADVLMPGLDGLGLCRALKGAPELCHIPVLIYTATFDAPEDERLARDLGASRFIVKPAEPAALLAAIDEVLEETRARRAPMALPARGAGEHLRRRYEERLTSKLAEKVEELTESRRALSTLIENLPGVVYRCRNDVDWTMLYISPVCELLTGYTPDDLIGNRRIAYAQIIHPKDREHVRREVRAAVFQGQRFQIDYRIFHADGGVRWVSEQGVGMTGSDGEVLLEGYISDVTVQRQAELERDRFFRVSLDLLCVADLEGRFRQVNPAWTQTLGWHAEELLGRCALDLVHPQDRAVADAALQRLAQGQPIQSFEVRHRCRDAGWRWLSWTAIPRLEEGAIYAAARDVTAEKTYAAELAQSRDRLLEAEAYAQVGHWGVEAATGALSWSEETYRILGLEPGTDPAAGLAVLAARASARDLALVRRRVRRLLSSGGEMRGDYRFRRPDGALRHVEIRAKARIDGAGRVIGLGGTVQDITERKRSEEQLREAERFAQATIEALTAHICVLDETGTILAVNRAWRNFGEGNPPAPGDARVGTNYLVFCDSAGGGHIEEARRFATGLRAVIRGEREELELEYPCHSPGEKRWFLGKATRFPGGGPVRVAVSHADVTERKQAEIALEEKARALRTLSAANEALVRSGSEADVVARVCDVVAAVGGYALACVCFPAGEGDLSLRLVHAAGSSGPVETDGAAVCADAQVRRMPLFADAIRSGRRRIDNDLRGTAGPVSGWPAFDRVRPRSGLVLPLASDGERIGLLGIFAREPGAFHGEEVKLLGELAEDLAFGIAVQRRRVAQAQAEDRLQEALVQTIRAIAVTVEKRDPYTAGHQQRVADLAAAIAVEMGLPERCIEGIRLGGLIHDIGKIYVPAEILSRPGRLSEIEFGLIKSHAQVGYEIVSGISFPWPIAEMIHQHHERLDGSGYPLGLKGEDILIESQILAVADVVEAVSAHRPYRPALGVDKGLEVVAEGRGTLFCAEAVDACEGLIRGGRFAFE